MNNLELLQSFFGWGSVVSIFLLVIISIVLLGFRKSIIKLHQKMIDIPENKLNELYFSFMAYFKIAVYMLFIIPYIALCLMNSQS